MSKTPPLELATQRLADDLPMHAVMVNWPAGKVGAIQKVKQHCDPAALANLKAEHLQPRLPPNMWEKVDPKSL